MVVSFSIASSWGVLLFDLDLDCARLAYMYLFPKDRHYNQLIAGFILCLCMQVSRNRYIYRSSIIIQLQILPTLLLTRIDQHILRKTSKSSGSLRFNSQTLSWCRPHSETSSESWCALYCHARKTVGVEVPVQSCRMASIPLHQTGYSLFTTSCPGPLRARARAWRRFQP